MSIIAVTFSLVNRHHNLMGDGQTEVVLLWETRAMSEQNLLVSAGSVPAGNVPAPNNLKHCSYIEMYSRSLCMKLSYKPNEVNGVVECSSISGFTDCTLSTAHVRSWQLLC
jgi:hypothetical protein